MKTACGVIQRHKVSHVGVGRTKQRPALPLRAVPNSRVFYVQSTIGDPSLAYGYPLRHKRKCLVILESRLPMYTRVP
jgi:hypothetical protein